MNQPHTAAQLVDTGPICCTAFDDHRLVWRPCRTWHTPEGYISVVTEIGHDGPSVTNATGKVYAALQRVRPGCRVIEHYLADSTSPERFAEILPAPPGVTAGVRVGDGIIWQHIPMAELRAVLGDPLETTRPAGPVEHGTWPTEAGR
ncbi:hypothetical protein [Nocardia pseudovaccinii]|uniref:hypothetical protein n=1 Tax=Nocardia pseudovaccinii TaxID=189540 RepID=UPI0007A40394|nr:hypothetical protein [Nocardia pseudovaccinii]